MAEAKLEAFRKKMSVLSVGRNKVSYRHISSFRSVMTNLLMSKIKFRNLNLMTKVQQKI